MSRTIDLKEYLPDYIRSYYEMKVIMDAESDELSEMWDIQESNFDKTFVVNFDEEQVAYYEGLFSITPSPEDTLESRKDRIISWLSGSSPYTLKWLMQEAAGLIGSESFDMTCDLDGYSINIMASTENRLKFLEFVKLIDKVLPCNLGRTITNATMYNINTKTKAVGIVGATYISEVTA